MQSAAPHNQLNADKTDCYFLYSLVEELEVSPDDLMAAASHLKLLDRKRLKVSQDEKASLHEYLGKPEHRATSMPTLGAIRIYVLARDISQDNAEIVALLPRLGILGIGSALGSLSGIQQSTVRAYYRCANTPKSRPTPNRALQETVPPTATLRKTVSQPGPPIAVPSPPRVRRKDDTSHQPVKGNLPPLAELPLMSKDPFLLELIDDVTEALKRLKEIDSAFHRRTYVRTYFSTAEAVIVTLRDWLSDRVASTPMTKRDSNFTRTLLQTGQLNFARSETAQFILGTYAFMRSCPKDFFQGDGWEAFQSSRKIRNALTHPKRQTGVTVSDEDLATVKAAHQWLFDVIGELEQRTDS